MIRAAIILIFLTVFAQAVDRKISIETSTSLRGADVEETVRHFKSLFKNRSKSSNIFPSDLLSRFWNLICLPKFHLFNVYQSYLENQKLLLKEATVII